jgi:hypothetical protein
LVAVWAQPVRLIVDAKGDLAWIASVAGTSKEAPFAGGPPYEVWKYDRAGKRIADSGASVDPRTLRLTANGFRWRDQGRLRSTTFK